MLSVLLLLALTLPSRELADDQRF